MKAATAVGIFKETFQEWRQDKALRLGAALAYYAVLSIPPLVVIILHATAFFYKGDGVASMQAQLGNLIGEETARTILKTQSDSALKGALSSKLLGIGILLFGATGVFASLQDALHTIWEVQPKPGRGCWGLVCDRFLSLSMVFGVAFLLMVSLVVSAGVTSVTALTVGRYPGGAAAIRSVELLLSFVVITVLFAVMFKTLPHVKLVWNDVAVGSVVTAALFTIGKFVIWAYLGQRNIGSTYGAAAPAVVLILWVYYSCQILLFGAEFTQVYANRYGSRIVPAEDAVPVTEEKRAQEGLEANTPARTNPTNGGRAA
jgi:membrane protein